MLGLEVGMICHCHRLDRPNVAGPGSDLQQARLGFQDCQRDIMKNAEFSGPQALYLAGQDALLHGAQRRHVFAPELLGLDTPSAEDSLDRKQSKQRHVAGNL